MSTINPRKTFQSREKVSADPVPFPAPAANTTSSVKHSVCQLSMHSHGRSQHNVFSPYSVTEEIQYPIHFLQIFWDFCPNVLPRGAQLALPLLCFTLIPHSHCNKFQRGSSFLHSKQLMSYYAATKVHLRYRL